MEVKVHLPLLLWGLASVLFQGTLGAEATPLQRLSRAHLEFALSLFREVAKDAQPTDNVLLSPFSVASVLSQLWLGAGQGSSTFRQLEQGLHYKEGGLSPDQVHRVFMSSLDTLHDLDFKSVVKQANAVFVQSGVAVNASYERDLRRYYNSSLHQVDFERGEEGKSARSVINRWVSKRTNGQIPELVEGPPPTNTKIMLVNALALKAFWKNSFDPTRTAANGIFHHDAKTKLAIPMMAGKFKVLLGESPELHCRLLELPFRGKRLSMFVILPDEEDAHSPTAKPPFLRLERNLTAANLKKLFSSLREEMVHIRMPRFSLSHSARLADSLGRLGFRDIFDPSQADFSGISAEETLSVNSLAHKVKLEITEKGAEGAAATAAGIERFGEIGDEFFEINRPFVFFIWDYSSGAVLFIGRVSMPTPLD